jgi:hypothetical protein
MFAKASVLLALATSAAAHMRLSSPIPFGVGTINNFPLEPADFPCKRGYQVSEMNQWDAGQTKDVSFQGSAAHGGGSCQFSITTDTEPTEASQWKVIHSVIGGCPTNDTGNIPVPGKPEGDAAALLAATFPVTMPDFVPDGQYTFAWTWLNKVGNREFYMDCAPIKVGGGGNAKRSSAAAALAALPDMFVANLPNTECHTTEDQDFVFPNPGDSVYTYPGAAAGKSLTGAGCEAQAKLAAGSGEPSTPTEPGYGDKPASSAPAASEPAASKPAATNTAGAPAAPTGAPSYPTGVPSNPDGGVLAPGASPAPSASPVPEVPAPKPEQPKPEQPKPAAPIASAAPAAPAAPSTPSSSDCTPCTEDGAIVCIGSNQFGLCNRGCAVAQALAQGTVCTNGVIGAKKRSINKFPRAHLHRRHGSGSRL